MLKDLQREFIFDELDEAMDTHKQLFELLRTDGFIAYQTLYTYVNHKTDVHLSADDYGWDHLYGSNVEPYGDDGQWVLKMPDLKKLSTIYEERKVKKNEN